MIAVSGVALRLADTDSAVTDVLLSSLLASDEFELLSGGTHPALPSSTLLDGLAPEVVTRALWWEQHIVEVLRGVRPDAVPGTRPRPQYNPAAVPLTRRETAKASELTAEGTPVTASAIAKRRRRYEARGVLGMVDHRIDKQSPPRRSARGGSAASGCRGHAGFFTHSEVGQILQAADGPGKVALPPQRTLYRMLQTLTAGKHTTGSARTRRSLALRPQGPFSAVHPAAPGELMQIDCTPLDVLVRLDDGVLSRVDLAGMIDVAARTVTAAVLRPTTKSVDASVLLARTVTPEPMRPGWPQAMAMSQSALPYRRLLDLGARLEHAAARPVIVPETIVVDHAKVFISRNFRASCNFLGINFRPCHQATPTDKPHIEKMMFSVGSLFAQYVKGYVGSSVERRGHNIDTQALWSLPGYQHICLRHRLWISPADIPQLDLTACPAITRAQRHTHYLARHFGAQQLMHVQLAAEQETRNMPYRPTPEPPLRHWRHRLQRLRNTKPKADIAITHDQFIRAALYPRGDQSSGDQTRPMSIRP